MTHDVATFDIIHPKRAKKLIMPISVGDPFVLFGFLLSIALIRFVIECNERFNRLDLFEIKSFKLSLFHVMLQAHRETSYKNMYNLFKAQNLCILGSGAGIVVLRVGS